MKIDLGSSIQLLKRAKEVKRGERSRGKRLTKCILTMTCNTPSKGRHNLKKYYTIVVTIGVVILPKKRVIA